MWDSIVAWGGLPTSKDFSLRACMKCHCYVVSFRAKTVQFCGSDSWHAGTVPVACVPIKHVGSNCSLRRSTYLEGFLVSSSHNVPSYVVPFRAKTAPLDVRIHSMLETVPILGPDKTCWIALLYAEEYRSRRISRFELVRSAKLRSYVVPFRAKTARFCCSDSWYAGNLARSLCPEKNLWDSIVVCGGVPTRRISDFELIRNAKLHCPVSSQNGAILLFGFMVCWKLCP
jgi:hypothetical protein